MKKYLILLCVIGVFAFAKAQQTTTYKRAKIHLNELHTLEELTSLDIAADHGIHKEGMFFTSDFSSEELQTARNHGYEITILNEDISAFYRSQNNQPRSSQNVNCTTATTETYTTPENFNQGSMGGYLTYQELLEELDEMAAQYPNLITQKTQISNFLTEGTPDTSVTPSIGGNPIYWLKISDNATTDEDEAQVLYTSIHHAREPMSLMNLVFYMWYLLENYDSDDAIKALVDTTELYFVPVVNPDGYLYNEVTDPNGGGLWRKNRKNTNGVDNNRNYNYFINGNASNGSWGGAGASSNPGSGTYHGPAPFSEVENQAIKWFVEQHNFVLALNNHTFGELLYYPFGYADVATPDDALYQNLGATLTSQNGYNALRDNPFAGDSDDFMYGTVGTHDKIFAFTPEIGTSFWPPASAIESTCQEMMYLNLTAARITQNYATVTDTGSPFISEDTSTAQFAVQRLGINGSGTFTVRIEAISDNITSTGDAVTFSNLASYESISGSIDFTLSDTVTLGDEIRYHLIVNNGLYDTVIPVTKLFGESTEVLLDEGDSTTTNFEDTDWGITNSTFVSASSSITDSPSGAYVNNEDSSIVLSETIDLSEAIAASVSFFARWDIEDTWDYVQFEISTNNGSSWQAQCGLLTTPGTNTQPNGQPLYDGTQLDWRQEQIDLSDYLGENILARFRLVSDNGVTRDGFYFDDLSFTIVNDENLSVTNDAFAKAFTIYPNPASQSLFIASEISMYEVTLYNLLGQKMINTTSQNGNAEIDISLFSDGMYFAKVQNGIQITTFKILKK